MEPNRERAQEILGKLELDLETTTAIVGRAMNWAQANAGVEGAGIDWLVGEIITALLRRQPGFLIEEKLTEEELGQAVVLGLITGMESLQ